jgi:hypothetical protein
LLSSSELLDTSEKGKTATGLTNVVGRIRSFDDPDAGGAKNHPDTLYQRCKGGDSEICDYNSIKGETADTQTWRSALLD